ncbi:diphthine--ammonia ligase isoform X2 [Belonocnema kinseyi]|uniref:diphthine--ammonia ligase isoform X2 n=1 Tax=Belonocnema kinseyi TaxID=2817044 RepID=UPI00143CC97F|nr:diphthine--ammonia ligase isoform X2 [Belonocnema kinseyi]
MRVVALISGGKDSCFSMMQCVAAGHDIVALANLYPVGEDELDSFMFQTVGHQGVQFISEAIGLPVYREPTFGKSKMQEKNYTPTDDDEVEDLYRLLKKVKDFQNIEAVLSGAISSDYQRIRVENVCSRLGLISLSYLWQRNQEDLYREMLECSVNAVIIKVAALGLESKHLGKSLFEMHSHLIKMKEKYGLNVCGEGGEYETFTLDCPLFLKSIVIDEYESIVHTKGDIAPVGYLNFKKIHLLNKNKAMDKLSLRERLQGTSIKAPFDYISDIICPKEKEDDPDHGTSGNGTADCEFVSNVSKKKPCEEYPDNPSWSENRCGWFYFGGITSKDQEAKSAIIEALGKLHNLVHEASIQILDIVSVTLYIKNMADYSMINEVYDLMFSKVNPPVRVCIECPLNVHIVLEALAYRDRSSARDGEIHRRHTMHVQSISNWAPANVGPYSQAVRIGDIILTAGQIPLVPGTMKILDSSIKDQCSLTLRHINRILEAMDYSTRLRDIVHGICFLTNASYIPEARKEWEIRTNNAIVDYIVVPALPRGASVEWCVWAHKDNSRFEYEETGRCVGNLNISLRRRWNYENNVSAIVCYLTNGLSDPTVNFVMETSETSIDLTAEELKKSFQYILFNLRKGSKSKNPACHLRVFYKADDSRVVQLILNALAYFSKENIVITIIPTMNLCNLNTFISVCGVRHE